MRSSTPKVLHELCGAPMVLWPVRAALDAGAAARRGRRLAPRGRSSRCCRRASSWPCSRARRRHGRGGASRRSPISTRSRRRRRPDDARWWCSAATCRSSAPRRSARWSRRTRSSGAVATMVTTLLEDPSGYGRVVRDASGALRAGGRDQGRAATRRPRSCEIREVNTGIYAFDAARAARRRCRG